MAISRSGLLFGVALALAVATASAQENIDSANYMLPLCQGFVDRKSSDPFEQGRCAGIIDGIAYMGFLVRAMGKLPLPGESMPRQLCLNVPEEVTVGQMVRVVIAYIEARPALMHTSFRGLALEALQAAWPCR
jgi:hypothetical protein